MGIILPSNIMVWVFDGVDRRVAFDGISRREDEVKYGAAYLDCYEVVRWMCLCWMRSCRQFMLFK